MLFCALSYIITGCETEHMEIHEAILSYTNYMSSIQHLLIGHDSTGHANYFLVPLVSKYIDNSGMARNGTWDTDVEKLSFSHMFNFDV